MRRTVRIGRRATILAGGDRYGVVERRALDVAVASRGLGGRLGLLGVAAEDEVGGPLGLCCGVDHQAVVVAELLELAADVRGRVVWVLSMPTAPSAPSRLFVLKPGKPCCQVAAETVQVGEY